jgi:ubiquitin C-terminal hydrolase
VLFGVDLLFKYFLKVTKGWIKASNKKGKVTTTFSKIVKLYSEKDRTLVNASDLLFLFEKRFDLRLQQDSHEFLIALLDTLNEETKKKRKKGEKEANEKKLEKNYSKKVTRKGSSGIVSVNLEDSSHTPGLDIVPSNISDKMHLTGKNVRPGNRFLGSYDHTKEKIESSVQADKSWNSYCYMNRSIVSYLFAGMLLRKTLCCNCNTFSNRFEEFYD